MPFTLWGVGVGLQVFSSTVAAVGLTLQRAFKEKGGCSYCCGLFVLLLSVPFDVLSYTMTSEDILAVVACAVQPTLVVLLTAFFLGDVVNREEIVGFVLCIGGAILCSQGSDADQELELATNEALYYVFMGALIVGAGYMEVDSYCCRHAYRIVDQQDGDRRVRTVDQQRGQRRARMGSLWGLVCMSGAFLALSRFCTTRLGMLLQDEYRRSHELNGDTWTHPDIICFASAAVITWICYMGCVICGNHQHRPAQFFPMAAAFATVLVLAQSYLVFGSGRGATWGQLGISLLGAAAATLGAIVVRCSSDVEAAAMADAEGAPIAAVGSITGLDWLDLAKPMDGGDIELPPPHYGDRTASLPLARANSSSLP
mmetsp:Transcript_42538/g.95662  ORF Transcript_42538/g.95662 Transcript_42538/m.95662 type:complete len:370 (+) Transcript_42538:79-1188(+)